ncbi:hypothetical protein ACJJTC_015386 [Scirpophaga incertulas]
MHLMVDIKMQDSWRARLGNRNLSAALDCDDLSLPVIVKKILVGERKWKVFASCENRISLPVIVKKMLAGEREWKVFASCENRISLPVIVKKMLAGEREWKVLASCENRISQTHQQS